MNTSLKENSLVQCLLQPYHLWDYLVLLHYLRNSREPLTQYDNASLTVLKSLIDQVNMKIKAQLSEGNDPGSLPEVPQGAPMDHIWIWIGIPCLAVSFFLSCCIFTFFKKVFKLGLQDHQNQNQSPQVELFEVPANLNV